MAGGTAQERSRTFDGLSRHPHPSTPGGASRRKPLDNVSDIQTVTIPSGRVKHSLVPRTNQSPSLVVAHLSLVRQVSVIRPARRPIAGVNDDGPVNGATTAEAYTRRRYPTRGRRPSLRARCPDGAPDRTEQCTMSDDATFERLRDIISNTLKVDREKVTLEASFNDDLNADSLDLVELIMAFEEEYGVEIPDEVARTITTVGAALAYVKTHGTH